MKKKFEIHFLIIFWFSFISLFFIQLCMFLIQALKYIRGHWFSMKNFGVFRSCTQSQQMKIFEIGVGIGTEMSIAAEKLPLPRWFSKKCSKFHCQDCVGPEILVLDHQIHSVSGFFTCRH